MIHTHLHCLKKAHTEVFRVVTGKAHALADTYTHLEPVAHIQQKAIHQT